MMHQILFFPENFLQTTSKSIILSNIKVRLNHPENYHQLKTLTASINASNGAIIPVYVLNITQQKR